MPRHGLRTLASGLLAMTAGLAACNTPGLVAGGASVPTGALRSAEQASYPPAPAAADRARWLLTFTAPPVATRFAGSADTGTAGSRQDRMRAYAEALRQTRQPALDAVRAMGLVVIGTSEYSTNAAIVEGPAQNAPSMAALRQLPGVGSVQPTGLYRADSGAPAAK